MKKGISFVIFFAIALTLLVAGFALSINYFTGKAISGQPENNNVPSIGPTAEEQQCMMKCMGCFSPGVGCTGNSEQCQAQCNVVKPEQTEEQQCVETCAAKGCEQYDFACQQKNQAACDKECGMIKEPEAQSEEESCIRECVKKEDPNLICKAGEGGEQGNEVCQKCAAECVHLYAGPCLNDEKLKEKQKTCETCEHCYGAPVMGDSGEGYECTVDIECKDASAEFGDDPGTGEGVVEKVGDFIGDAAGSVVDFFKGIFSDENNSE